MAEDTQGMGIPLPADSTPIHQYPKIAREMGEAIAKILAGGIMPAGMATLAAQQVLKALTDADVLTGDDPRSPRLGDDPELLFAIRDTAGRMTWLAANAADGGPTPWAVELLSRALGVGPTSAPGYLFAVTDADRRLTDLAIRSTDGQFDDFVIDRLRPRILAGFTPADQRTYADTVYSPGSDVFPVKADSLRAVGWGSSSMQFAGGILGAAFTAHGASWLNAGQGGERAEHIAARLGSVPALLTVPGGKLPASGSVEVTASNMPIAPLMKTYAGTLGSVRGSLAYAANPARLVFTRQYSANAAPVPLAPDTPFIPDAISYRDAVTLLWMGKNNMTDPGAVETVIRLTDFSFDWLAPLEKRCLVLGHFADTGSSAGARDNIRAVNAAHRKRYGSLFLDVDAYVTGSKIWTDTGITPTDADRTQQSLGNKPPSLSADAGHLNDVAGYAIRDHLLIPALEKLGWY